MDNLKISKYRYHDFIEVLESQDNKKVIENIKDEYTGKDLKIASDILANKDSSTILKKHTQEELERVKQQYFEKGWAESEKSEKTLSENKKNDNITNILSNIRDNIEKISEEIRSNYELISKDCIELSYTLASKLSSQFKEDQKQDDAIKQFLNKNLPLLTNTNTIKIKITPINYDEILKHLDTIDIAIQIQLIKDESIDLESCEIDWGKGLIKKDQEKIKKDLESIFDNNTTNTGD
ncbi:MAG: hypothetical protein ACI8ZF_000332 [Candidatus Midichloriaceae bacterium]|jgi:hypothetical protein